MRTTITGIVARHPATTLIPRAFMIGWHGVPILVYQGFSPSLANLKQHIRQALRDLPPEAPGSRWPKTSLGALPDERPLDLDSLRRLRTLCDRMTADLVAAAKSLPVTRLEWVQHECRSLERRSETVSMALMLKTPEAGGGDAPDPVERDRVEALLRGFRDANLAAYLSLVNRSGHRIDHYRQRAIGRSLVFDLADKAPALIEAFISGVEGILPGRYAWFAPNRRHVTIRRLSR
jgi:hypothetical protein